MRYHPPPAMPLFTASAIDVAVGGQPLLAAVGLALAEGEVVALTGPSGSGKTSLLRVLALLDDPTGGALTLRDRPPSAWGYPEWRRRVSYLAQRPVMLDGTLRDNMRRAFDYGTVDGEYSEERVAELLERLGIEPSRLDQTARELSEGQQQRATLLRTLLVEPDVLLLDEPTSALDADAAEAVRGLIREVVEAGGAALVVTHDAAAAESWCDRTIDIAGARADRTDA